MLLLIIFPNTSRLSQVESLGRDSIHFKNVTKIFMKNITKNVMKNLSKSNNTKLKKSVVDAYLLFKLDFCDQFV